MLLRLYKHNKRINSTLLPSNDDLLITGEVVFKRPTSVDKPTFILACGANDMPYARIANYAEFQGTYFWITELIQTSNTHIEISCEIDVLATYKNQILETKAYVLYSDSAGRTDILDSRSVATIEIVPAETITTPTTPKIFAHSQGGSFMLQCVNSEPTVELATMCIFFMNTAIAHDVGGKLQSENFLDICARYFFKPIDFIGNFMWFPFNYKDYLSAGQLINEVLEIGQYSSGVFVDRVRVEKHIEDVVVLSLPESLTNTYTNSANYCRITAYLPYVGEIDLPVELLIGSSTITFKIIVDLISGSIGYKIMTQDKFIGMYTAPFGTKLPIGSSTENIGAYITGLTGSATAIAGAVMANPLIAMGGIATSTTSIGNMPITNQKQGVAGSALPVYIEPNIILNIYKTKLSTSVTNRKEALGLPYCSTVELSTLSGYCQCQGASVSAIAMPEELEKINEYLNGGFYIE